MIRFLKRRKRAGAIIVLTAVMMVLMFAFLAFAVDLGYVALVRTQLQTAADSAAMAGAYDLLQSHFADPEPTDYSTIQAAARQSTQDYVTYNDVAGTNTTALAGADVTIGRLDLTNRQLNDEYPDPGIDTEYPDESRFNAVQVRVRRASDQNGEVPLFFARVLGINTAPSRASATAAFGDNFQGFGPPAEGSPNLPILPIALDEQTWDQLLAGNTGDSWRWNPDTNQVSPGQDQKREASLFPQGIGAPGNRGTVDIGKPNNSTKDLSRQIREGITAQDLADLQADGRSLEPGPDGTILLNGDTGMSGGIKDDLASIIGQTRIIPIFSNVTGNGNNAEFTIVQFAGVRILAVKLTGKPSGRYVVIQPANVLIENGIPAPDDTQFSDYIYSRRIWLVR